MNGKLIIEFFLVHGANSVRNCSIVHTTWPRCATSEKQMNITSTNHNSIKNCSISPKCATFAKRRNGNCRWTDQSTDGQRAARQFALSSLKRGGGIKINITLTSCNCVDILNMVLLQSLLNFTTLCLILRHNIDICRSHAFLFYQTYIHLFLK